MDALAKPKRRIPLVLWVVLWVAFFALFLPLAFVTLTVLTIRDGGDAKQVKAQLGCKVLADAIQNYRNHPDNTKHEDPNQLRDLITPPFGKTSYLKNDAEDLIDPWGQEYRMKPYQQSDGTTIIQVYTHDKKDGTPISQFGVGKTSRVKDE